MTTQTANPKTQCDLTPLPRAMDGIARVGDCEIQPRPRRCVLRAAGYSLVT